MPLLTRNGYIVENLSIEHAKELTVTPITFYPDEVPKSFEVFIGLPDGTFAVPRHWAKDKFGPADVFKGSVDCAPRLVFDGELRSKVQEDAASKSVDMLNESGGGVLCLPTGTGKTIIALHVACTMKVKTLVIVHKQFLMDQWAERIKQFVPLARVGRLQQGKIDVHGCDIVVGMLQSIAVRQYEPEVFDGFGLVVLDEVHVVPAPVFSQALLKICSPCMLGISATPERRDGLSNVIHWFVGPVFLEHQLTGKAEVTVFVVPRKCNFNIVYDKSAMAGVVTRLCKDAGRNDIIVNVTRNLVKDGHKVIVLSDRRDHCNELKKRLSSYIACMLYIGGMKEEQLKEHTTKDVLLATFAMAKEGLDIPELDALVLANPRSDIVQACGRILHGSSKNPVIVDIVDEWPIGRAQFNKRKAYYNKSGFTIKQW